MATIDIVILVVIGAGAVVGFMKGFVKQLATLSGLIAGLLAAKALYASVAEKVFSKVTDSMTALGIRCDMDSRTAVFYVDSLVADKGDGGDFARMAEPLAGLRIGGVEVSFISEPAGRCHRVYRCGQHAARPNKEGGVGVILSHAVVCRNILSRSQACYRTIYIE